MKSITLAILVFLLSTLLAVAQEEMEAGAKVEESEGSHSGLSHQWKLIVVKGGSLPSQPVPPTLRLPNHDDLIARYGYRVNVAKRTHYGRYAVKLFTDRIYAPVLYSGKARWGYFPPNYPILAERKPFRTEIWGRLTADEKNAWFKVVYFSYLYRPLICDNGIPARVYGRQQFAIWVPAELLTVREIKRRVEYLDREVEVPVERPVAAPTPQVVIYTQQGPQYVQAAPSMTTYVEMGTLYLSRQRDVNINVAANAWAKADANATSNSSSCVIIPPPGGGECPGEPPDLPGSGGSPPPDTGPNPPPVPQ